MDINDHRDQHDDKLEVAGRFESRDIVLHKNSTGETVAGSVGGAAIGAAWGTLGGPIGTILGGLAGAVGGWWAARSATEQHLFDVDDDASYRAHHQTMNATADRPGAGRYSYDDVRPLYQMGHLAGANPDYDNRTFDDIEPELRNAYSTAGQKNWDDVRGYAREAYSRGREVAPRRSGSASATPVMNAGSTPADSERGLRESSSDVVDGPSREPSR